MKKINLLKDIIIVDKNALLQAINSQKEFGITAFGEIVYEPKEEILIYRGKLTPKHSALKPPKPLTIQQLLGENYKIVENEDKVAIKAALAWQDIIKLNYTNASYDDTTNDGVNEFSNQKLEEIGWWADEFEIKYRELIDIIEKECEGTLLCVEQDEPYRFSGLGFIADNEHAYRLLYQYCKEKIEHLIASDPLYAKENLNDDEQKAAQYFGIL